MIPQCCSLPTCSLSERLLTPCSRTSSFVASPFPFRFHLVCNPLTAIGTFPVDTLLQQLKAVPLRVCLSPSPSIHTRAHTLLSLTCEVTCPTPHRFPYVVQPPDSRRPIPGEHSATISHPLAAPPPLAQLANCVLLSNRPPHPFLLRPLLQVPPWSPTP